MTAVTRAEVHLVRSPEQWGAEIRSSLGRTVEAVVEVGLTLLACKQEIGHGGFEDAVRHAGMSPRSARCFMSIADHPAIANRQHVADLPASWGSLYELTQLGDDLPLAIEAGEVHPDMTRRQVVELVRRYQHPEESQAEPSAGAARRTDLPAVALADGVKFRKSLERVVRIVEDDRFARNKQVVAPELRSHLLHAIEVCQDLLARIDQGERTP